MGFAGNLMEQRLKDLLSDLGRRTLRGVKPCPKCGTYNGTRGFSCKNKSCDVVFKVAEDRKKKTTEACRVVTDNRSVQVCFTKCCTKCGGNVDLVESEIGSKAYKSNL